MLGLAVAVSAAELTQRDWLEQLTDSLGWGYGLPDDPVEDNYIALLSGERNVFVEAEKNHRSSDLVAVKRQTNFGPYSGSGWVSGRREPVQLHLDFLLPHNGRYQLSTATRLPGVKFQIAEREFIASAGAELTQQDLGAVELVAGPVEVVVSLPPDAGVDYLQLSATPLPRIAPLAGWQPDRLLKTGDLAVTMLQALDLLETIPHSGRVFSTEAETAMIQPGVFSTDDRHLGTPNSGQWVRSGHLRVDWQFPVSVPEPGCYQLRLRGSSNVPVDVVLAGVLEKQVTFESALGSVSLGNYCLPEGQKLFQFNLPPWAGIDSLEMHELDTRTETLARLLGLPDEQNIERETLNELLRLLSSLTY